MVLIRNKDGTPIHYQPPYTVAEQQRLDRKLNAVPIKVVHPGPARPGTREERRQKEERQRRERYRR